MSKTPFMPLWVSDFLGDTLDLDAAEIGAYMLLLMAQWNRDGNSLPDDQEKLKRVARCGRSWPKIWGNIQRYFSTDENGVYSKRLRLESQNVALKREVNRHNGALGGIAKSLKYNERGVANATNSLERNASIPEPEPYKEKRDTKVSPKKGSRLSDDWFLPTEWGEWAISEGWPDTVIRSEADKFKDFWISKTGRDASKLDWQATWRNWMRNSKQRKIGNGNGHYNGSSQGKRPDAALEQIARLAGLGQTQGDGGH